VLATAPAGLAEHMRGLGADLLIDFTLATAVDHIRQAFPSGIDAFVDLITTDGAVPATRGRPPYAPGASWSAPNGAAETERLATLGLTGVNSTITRPRRP
jgi:hypothetical protein